MENEIGPGASCLDLTGIAYCLRQDDPTGIFARLCAAFISVGAYCGCKQPPEGLTLGRLCGGNKDTLPEPARVVNPTPLGLVTTCFYVEFAIKYE